MLADATHPKRGEIRLTQTTPTRGIKKPPRGKFPRGGVIFLVAALPSVGTCHEVNHGNRQPSNCDGDSHIDVRPFISALCGGYGLFPGGFRRFSINFGKGISPTVARKLGPKSQKASVANINFFKLIDRW